MRSMAHPHYAYKPWSEERRRAHRERVLVRAHGVPYRPTSPGWSMPCLLALPAPAPVLLLPPYPWKFFAVIIYTKDGLRGAARKFKSHRATIGFMDRYSNAKSTAVSVIDDKGEFVAYSGPADYHGPGRAPLPVYS